MTQVERLLVNVCDDSCPTRLGESQNGNIDIKIILCLEHLGRQSRVAEIGRPRCGPRQYGIEVRRPSDLNSAGHHMLHRLFWPNPRSAATGPTRSRVESKL